MPKLRSHYFLYEDTKEPVPAGLEDVLNKKSNRYYINGRLLVNKYSLAYKKKSKLAAEDKVHEDHTNVEQYYFNCFKKALDPYQLDCESPPPSTQPEEYSSQSLTPIRLGRPT